MKRVLLSVLALVVFLSPATAQETTRFFAAAASAEGENSTFWLTDARVFNPDTEQEIIVHLAFLRKDMDNSGADEVQITVAPRSAVALNDLVGETFSVTGSGGVRLRSDMPFLATSRTYNIGDGTTGTFGQFIAGLEPGQALTQGILLSVINDPAADGFRSNLGFVNPSDAEVIVGFTVFDLESGSVVGESEITLDPLAFSQFNVFSEVGATTTVVGNASVEFTADAPVFAYASVVDNTSGDAIFVLPSADSGTPGEENNPPQGTIIVPAADLTVQLGEMVSFEAEVSDPDGDEITGAQWDFGDDITASGLVVTHTFSEVGVFGITFTATDEHGLTDPSPATRTITVVEAAATFAEVQTQIFDLSCAFSGCHAGGSPSQGLDLSAGQAHNNIVGVAAIQMPSLNLIEASDPESSYLWLKLIDDPSISGAQMPRGAAPLSSALLDLMRSWIEGGAADD